MPDSTTDRQPRAPHIEWVPIEKMKVSEAAQRKYSPQQAQTMADDFDLEALGYPVLNRRDGDYYIVDGQHRVGALKLIGWGDQSIECEVYTDLTEAEEAELFLRRDSRRRISAMEKFKIGVTAGRAEDVAIDDLVKSLGMTVAYYPGQRDSIGAIGTLRRVYQRSGGRVLGSSLAFLRDAFGVAGMSAHLIDGMALVVARYGEAIDGKNMVEKLAGIHGGANGLLNRSNTVQRQTGTQLANCVASVIVSQYNSGRAGNWKGRLTPWWKLDEPIGA